MPVHPPSDVLAVVAARGGSKGLPRKNVLPLAGVPVVVWTLRAAAASRTLAETLVSTEDAEIARVCREAGGSVPFTRPAELARDDSSIVDVLRHAVAWWEGARGRRAGLVVLLQPTSPLRGAADIDAVVDLMRTAGCDSAQTVCVDERHPWHRFFLEEGGRLRSVHPQAEAANRRQEHAPLYMPTGAVYAVRRDVLMEEGRLHGKDRRAVVCPPERSVDVDSAADLALAEHYAAK